METVAVPKDFGARAEQPRPVAGGSDRAELHRSVQAVLLDRPTGSTGAAMELEA